MLVREQPTGTQTKENCSVLCHLTGTALTMSVSLEKKINYVNNWPVIQWERSHPRSIPSIINVLRVCRQWQGSVDITAIPRSIGHPDIPCLYHDQLLMSSCQAPAVKYRMRFLGWRWPPEWWAYEKEEGRGGREEEEMVELYFYSAVCSVGSSAWSSRQPSRMDRKGMYLLGEAREIPKVSKLASCQRHLQTPSLVLSYQTN